MNGEEVIVSRLQRLIKEKGDSLEPSDFLLPELQWIIGCATLSYEDRQFAELRYIKGMGMKMVMDEMAWYSPHTFTRHNKLVWLQLMKTLRILTDC